MGEKTKKSKEKAEKAHLGDKKSQERAILGKPKEARIASRQYHHVLLHMYIHV